MKKNRLFLAIATLVVGVAVFFSCSKSELSDSSDLELKGATVKTTAQSIMIDINAPEDYVLTGNGAQVWHFDVDAAATYFNVATTGTPSAIKIANLLDKVARANKCAFWTGSALTGDAESKTNGQSPYSITITPKSASNAPQTAWVEEGGAGNGTAKVDVNINIAGLSFNNAKQFAPLGKYSFTLGDLLNDRVGDVTVTLSQGETVVKSEVIPHTLVFGNLENDCLGSLVYTANPLNYFGEPTLKSKLQAQDAHTMAYILTHDSFAGNDAICGTTAIAKVDQFSYDLEAGDYVITVSTVVKGNDGIASVTVIQNAPVHVAAQGCQND